jgi:hypothetical protein
MCYTVLSRVDTLLIMRSWLKITPTDRLQAVTQSEKLRTRLERIRAVISEKMPVPVIGIDSIDADERLATIDDIQYMCPIRNLQVRDAFGSCLTYCLIGALPSMIYHFSHCFDYFVDETQSSFIPHNEFG